MVLPTLQKNQRTQHWIFFSLRLLLLLFFFFQFWQRKIQFLEMLTKWFLTLGGDSLKRKKEMAKKNYIHIEIKEEGGRKKKKKTKGRKERTKRGREKRLWRAPIQGTLSSSQHLQFTSRSRVGEAQTPPLSRVSGAHWWGRQSPTGDCPRKGCLGHASLCERMTSHPGARLSGAES